ncbi:trimeric intracellular cation channel type 1B.1-like [Ruditapes philippinarum]|uniref:trimeric intracellular cation channel type 1B.1-like n=1 Tax=Ruditapes philippinarum TaxID=129788 RepID=UPI00295B9C2C|nr:trimeric intracellular cation channel type 1B.1-like [Ruditapes philippinarum]XP_060563964.1 trimeric intracellular cation channel type 1B.1-like [Ruditapes philippinarum]
MDPQTFMDIATKVTKLKMYPYFDIAHYTLMCMSVRDDLPLNQPAGTQPFYRRHPLSTWLSSMLLCFAGSIIANILLGEPAITPFKDHRSVLTSTAVWYLVFYSPFDVVYKLARLLPFKMVICGFKEVQRASKIYAAVNHTAKLYPNAYLIIVLVGTIKGAGSYLMKNFERLIRGVWMPGSNEILQPSFATKACLVASIVFLLERLNYIQAPHPIIYFGVVIFFVYFKLSALLLGIHDPFAPFENLFCAIFMGGMWDALRRAVVREQKPADASDRNDMPMKSKEEKKKD